MVSRGNQEIENKLDFEAIFNLIQEVQTVCHDLQVKELKYRIDKKQTEANECHQMILGLQDLTIEKIKDISYHICSYADSFQPDSEGKENKEEFTKAPQGKNDMVCAAKPDMRLAFLVAYYVKANAARSQVDFHEAQIKATPPVSLKTMDYIMRIFWTSFDYLSHRNHDEEETNEESGQTSPAKKLAIDNKPKDYYSKDMVLGGVLSSTIFDMPSAPISFKGWKIKHIKDERDALSESNIVKSDGSSQIQKGSYTRLIYKIPSNLYIGNPKKNIAIWIKERGAWAMDSDFIDRESIQFHMDRTIDLHTYRLAPICFMQTRCLDFPYKSWKFRSIKENDLACLDIEGQRLFIQFHIGMGFVQLKRIIEKDNLSGQSLKEFADLMNKDFEPEQLLYEMYRCGVNLLPVNQDAEHCNIQIKNMDAEERAIDEMSMAVRAYFFRSFKWMATTPKGSFGLYRNDHGGIHTKHRV